MGATGAMTGVVMGANGAGALGGCKNASSNDISYAKSKGATQLKN